MDEITVPLKELYAQISQMVEDGMDYVILSIMEADDSAPDDPLPPFLNLGAFSSEFPEEEVMYDGVDAADFTPPEG